MKNLTMIDFLKAALLPLGVALIPITLYEAGAPPAWTWTFGAVALVIYAGLVITLAELINHDNRRGRK